MTQTNKSRRFVKASDESKPDIPPNDQNFRNHTVVNQQPKKVVRRPVEQPKKIENKPEQKPNQQAKKRKIFTFNLKLRKPSKVFKIISLILGITTFVMTEILVLAYFFMDMFNNAQKNPSVLYYMMIIVGIAAGFAGFAIIIKGILKIFNYEGDDVRMWLVDIIVGLAGIFSTVWLFISMKEPIEALYPQNFAIYVAVGWAIGYLVVTESNPLLATWLIGALMLIKVWLCAISVPNFYTQYVSIYFGWNMVCLSVMAGCVFGILSFVSHILLEDRKRTFIVGLIFDILLVAYSILLACIFNGPSAPNYFIYLAWLAILPAGLAYGFGYYKIHW